MADYVLSHFEYFKLGWTSASTYLNPAMGTVTNVTFQVIMFGN